MNRPCINLEQKRLFIPKEKMRRIIKAAIQAPTPDNCQPYTYHWSEDKLEIFHNSPKSDFAPDPRRFFSVFCLGIVSESIDIACSAEDLTPEFSYALFAPDDKPWCTINFVNEQRSADELNSVIYKRCSDRRQFKGGTFEGDNLKKINQDAERFEESNLYLARECTGEHKRFLHDAYSLMFYWRKFRGNLLRWWHTSDKAAEKTREGLTWRALNIPLKMLRSMRFFHNIYWLGNVLFPKFYGDKLIEYNEGAGLGCITVTSRNPEALIDAGRLCIRNWLRINRIGYGYGPQGIIMHNYLYELSALGPDIPNRYYKITSEGTKTLRKVFGFSESELPVWGFRTGISDGEFPDNMRTLRPDVSALSNV